MEMEQIISLVMMLFLTVLAYEDLRTGTMNIVIIGTCGATGLILRIITGTGTLEIMSGTIVGALLLILAFASSQAVGYGDGFLFAASGIYLGLIRNVIFLLLSLILGAVTSIVLMAARIKKKNERIPFVPFMLAGYVLMLGIY